jgi:hypothetical protein
MTIPSLFNSCQNHSVNPENEIDYKILESLCNSSYERFNSSGYDKIETFSKFRLILEKLKYSSNNLIANVENNNINKQEIEAYLHFTDSIINLCLDKKSKFENLPIDRPISNDIDQVKTNIKMHECLAVSSAVNMLFYNWFDIDNVHAIAVPSSNDIKLGEQYSARIYFAAGNSLKPYIALIGKDTIKDYINDGTSQVPIYRVTPTKKGKDTINGLLIVDNFGKKYEYSFQMDYIVK